jgi:hypothetical protein
MDSIMLSIAEMRRFPHMTGQNERFCPKLVRLKGNNRVGYKMSGTTLARVGKGGKADNTYCIAGR